MVFSYIVYKSREHRDSVHGEGDEGQRLANMMDPKNMPFDGKRMIWGGFKTMVDM